MEDLLTAIEKIKQGHYGSAINLIERYINTQEEMYNEQEVEKIAKDAYIMGRNNLLIGVFNKWFKQFKK
jgi:hypothetical protein